MCNRDACMTLDTKSITAKMQREKREWKSESDECAEVFICKCINNAWSLSFFFLHRPLYVSWRYNHGYYRWSIFILTAAMSALSFRLCNIVVKEEHKNKLHTLKCKWWILQKTTSVLQCNCNSIECNEREKRDSSTITMKKEIVVIEPLALWVRYTYINVITGTQKSKEWKKEGKKNSRDMNEQQQFSHMKSEHGHRFQFAPNQQELHSTPKTFSESHI